MSLRGSMDPHSRWEEKEIHEWFGEAVDDTKPWDCWGYAGSACDNGQPEYLDAGSWGDEDWARNPGQDSVFPHSGGCWDWSWDAKADDWFQERHFPSEETKPWDWWGYAVDDGQEPPKHDGGPCTDKEAGEKLSH